MLLQVSLQKAGGGAVDALQISDALCALGVPHVAIINMCSEVIDLWGNKNGRKVLTVATYASSVGSFLLYSISFFRVYKIVRAVVRCAPHKVYATHFHPWLIFFLCLRPFLGFKFIYSVHENPFSDKEKKNVFFGFLEKFIFSRADIIITHSGFIKQQIVSHVSVPVFVIPLGAYTVLQESVAESSKENTLDNILRIACVGRIEAYKGLDVLLGALRVVNQHSSRVHLTVAGRGHVDSQLWQEMNALHVTVINKWLLYRELYALVQRSDVVVVPYVAASQSGVISLAMAAGVPVIASNVGGLPEQVIDGVTGLLFRSTDVYDLASKIESLCDNLELLWYMKKQIPSKIDECFSWKKNFITLKEVLQ